MRKFKPGSLILILSGIILYLVSCTPGSCFEETESYLKASFYKNTTRTPPDSLILYGLNRDSLIYNKKANIQPALIPLDALTDHCTFIIIINGISDTIEFQYTSYPHLISKECGYTYYHHLETEPKSSENAIKRIEITNSTITNLNVENIRIYY